MLGFGKVIERWKKTNTNQSMPNYHVKYFDFIDFDHRNGLGGSIFSFKLFILF
jgi:hypothetical protein